MGRPEPLLAPPGWAVGADTAVRRSGARPGARKSPYAGQIGSLFLQI